MNKELFWVVVGTLFWAAILWLLFGREVVYAVIFVVVFALVSERIGNLLYYRSSKKPRR